MSHTPGPWSVERGEHPRDFIVAERSGNTICEPNAELYAHDSPHEFDSSVRRIDLPEALANAALIAAAPDLLAALIATKPLLQKGFTWWQMYYDANPSEESAGHLDGLLAVIADVDAAIAKAEGKP